MIKKLIFCHFNLTQLSMNAFFILSLSEFKTVAYLIVLQTHELSNLSITSSNSYDNSTSRYIFNRSLPWNKSDNMQINPCILIRKKELCNKIKRTVLKVQRGERLWKLAIWWNLCLNLLRRSLDCVLKWNGINYLLWVPTGEVFE